MVVRAARVVVSGLLVVVAPLIAWQGGVLASLDFVGPGGDSPYLLIGGVFVGVAGGAALAAWLLGVEVFRPRRRTAGLVFVAAVVLLPLVAGVLTGVAGARRWRPYQHPSDGYTLRYPPRWSLFPPTRADQPRGAITLTSWSAGSPVAAPIPAGGMTVTVGPSDGPPPRGEPVAVGEAPYPGTIVAPMSGATAPSLAEGPHTITIVYAAEGRTWRIVGAFAEPPDGANPNAATFRALVASIRHRR